MSEYPELEVLRIYIGENQKHAGRPLYEVIVQEARERGLTGAVVSRGMMGFWKYGPISTSKIMRLSQDLPIVIEIAGEDEHISAFLPDLDVMIKNGLVTMEKARVVINRDDGG